MNRSLWIKDNTDFLCFENCFIADIPEVKFPIKDGEDVFEDEMDISPVWLRLKDFETMSDDFKEWYEASGFGYIYLEPGFFDLTPYKLEGPVNQYTIDGEYINPNIVLPKEFIDYCVNSGYHPSKLINQFMADFAEIRHAEFNTSGSDERMLAAQYVSRVQSHYIALGEE